ncbi:myelin protein zero-like 1 like isoform X1 [Osmerus eperlanus]|uniref:myelin protein zero-like 1 like isoform X1 n=1 Tax=Osmerus eperlanus TaxID=29151 RepID=UPI002E0DD4AD
MELRLTNPACRVLLCGFTLSIIFGTTPSAAIDVYTPPELLVENGTTGVLRCSFRSREVISSQASVAWNFRPHGADPSSSGISIFYYSAGKEFQGSLPQFVDRIKWVGDLNKKDVSVQLLQAQFNDNGTYLCDVKNPPDISGTPSRTELKVVMKESLPQTSTGVIVGAVFGAVIGLILIALVTCLIIKRHQTQHDYEGCTSVESMSSHAARPGKKPASSSEGSRCSSPSAPLQVGAGPVIYAQLDHSGSQNPNSFHKMEPVVYADIRKN